MSGTFHGLVRKARTGKRKALPQDSRLVIVGNGMVGAKLCENLVEAGLHERLEITVIGEEPHPAYNRVKLSTYVEHRSHENLEILSRDWYETHQITLLTGTRVEAIDRGLKSLKLSSSSRLTYDYLVLATGSRPFIPPIPGAESDLVFPYRNIADLDRIIAAADGKICATVIGGGLLGLEAAQALQSLELKTSVIERANFLMPQQLNEQCATILQDRVSAMGIDLHLGVQDTSILEKDRQLTLSLSGDPKLPADLVVVSAGIIPNSELAEEAGLVTGVRGGIVVDDNLETEDPCIFALGECALLHGRIYGLVAPGYTMAAHLTARFQGKKVKSLAPLDLSTRLKMLGVDVTSIGEALQEGRQLEYLQSGSYRMMILGRKRVLTGALAIGDWPENSQVHSLYSQGAKITRKQEDTFLATGELFPDQQQESPALWPASRIVCNCVSVTKGEITGCMASCQNNPDKISQATGASSVCGSCRPLVEQLCGAPVSAPKRTFAVPALLGTSLIAFALTLYAIIFPGAPISDSVESTWYKVEQLWRNNLFKQITGYSLAGIFLIGLIISLRKRLSWFKWGRFTTWRFFHAAFGLTALCALWAHTGFHFGSNLNFWLMLVFVLLNLLGALAGIVTAIETKGNSTAASIARRMRRPLTWTHLILFWPLPVLLTFHILSVYLY